MEELTRKLNELKQEVELLKRPKTLSDDFIQLLISNGFIKANTIIPLSEDNGLTIQENEYLQAFILGTEKTIFLRNKLNQFYVKTGGEDIYSLNTYIKPDGSIGKLEPGDIIVLSSTGTPPDPIIGGTLYSVLTATTDSFTVEDPGSPGNPIEFTDTGIGTHYWYKT